MKFYQVFKITKKHYLLYLLPIFILFSACSNSQSDEHIVQQKEIEPYLNKQTFEKLSGLPSVQGDLEFWKTKLDKHPGNFGYESKLAAAYSARFGITKNIEDLHRADSLYKMLGSQSYSETEGYSQTLAQFSTTKHHFEDSEKFSYAALKEGGDTRSNNLLLIDALMYRGEYVLAKKRLDRLKGDFSFGYFTRKSKYKDYEGKRDSAIYYLKTAADKLDKRSSLYTWAESILGDRYGHANRVEESYKTYLNVLNHANSRGSYLHVLKGVAWIAYSHDKNTELAKKILHFVDQQIQSPDIKLILSKIAEYEGNTEEKRKYLNAYVDEARKPTYYGMYDAYLIKIAVKDFNNTEWAMQMVKKELKNRPTPTTYSLEAWVYLHQDKPEKALEIIKEHVVGKTYEPVPVYYMARIFDANDLNEKARKYYEEALVSSYELGPVITGEIKERMNS